jgi:hypothetical protein
MVSYALKKPHLLEGNYPTHHIILKHGSNYVEIHVK